MTASSLTKEGLAEQARHVLQTLLADASGGNASYLSAMRGRLGPAPLMPVEEQVAFLEKFGYLLVNRTNNTLSLTRDGELVANGDKFGDLTGDAAHYFDAKLKSLGRALGPSRPRKPVGEILDDRYRKLGQIGSGGVGTVFRGSLLTTERAVAIKIVKDIFVYFTETQRREVVRRLEGVVRQSSRLTHPNVAQIIDANTSREHPYVITQLSPSGSLRRILAVDEHIPAARVIAYFIQMCHGLRSAHQLGLTHRGLKPENVLLDLYGNVMLSDFGMARIVERDSGLINQVFVGMGSVAYMAPEQFADARSADARSDIYALGILLYELCTRRLPGRRSAMPSEVNRELPKGLDDIFDQMTQDAPEDRFGSVQEVLDALYAATGVEAHLDRRRAVLFAESPSFELGLDMEDGEEGVSVDGSSGSVPVGPPMTMESPPPAGADAVVIATPSRLVDRVDRELSRPPMGVITEDRLVAPPVPSHMRSDSEHMLAMPPSARPTPAPQSPVRAPIVDDDFDELGSVAIELGSSGDLGKYDPDDSIEGSERLYGEPEPRLPGSDPRKSRSRASATTPGPLAPRKPGGK